MQSRRAHHLALAAIIVALASAGAGGALAQEDITVTVGACRNVQSPLARLDCYDRAFPPLVDAGNGAPASNAEPAREGRAAPQPEPREVANSQRRNAVADERSPVSATHARIVEITMPSLSTTVLVAADGRVFTRSNTTIIVRWPPAPFDVDIEMSRLGNSTYLIHPRTGERVRVAVRN